MDSAGVSSIPGPRISNQKASLVGFVYIGAAAFFWGLSASLGRAAFTGRLLPHAGIHSVNPLILSQCRTGFSFIAVAIGLVARRGFRQLSIPGRDFVRLFALGLGGVAASNYFYYLAIHERTSRRRSSCSTRLRYGCCCIWWRDGLSA